MKKMIYLFFKGFIMGIANIIPGVSGGTLAIILGIYEDFINAISHFFSDFKKNILFLLPVFLGMGVAILSMSNVISFSYKHIPIATTLFFVGLVLGGIPLLTKKLKESKGNKKSIINYLIFVLTFALVIFMALADTIFSGIGDINLTKITIIKGIILFFVGIIAAGTMVIPGVSGSLVLMLLGFYYPIIDTIKDLIHFNHLFSNVIVLGIFGIGVLVGIIGISKLFEYLFKKQETKTYFGVLGFIYASILAIPYSALHSLEIKFHYYEIIIAILLFILGMVIAYFLGDKKD
ncbi:MAG: DUF368 domain-containing protein [Bacilli bacterium]|nr:DUF368 domain-containing protein [Bacilli bacterium]